MSPNFQISLSKLERLSPSKLDKASRRIRGAMADAEWKMGLCLLALKRSGAFRKLGFGTLSAYAERVLQLSGRKVGALLGAAEALEHLPLMSEAFRAGKVCWSKVRVMHGLATPETEAAWLEFARAHTSVEVERKVALSPLEWKRHRALKASLAGKPSVTPDEVKEMLISTKSEVCGSSESARAERAVAESLKGVSPDGVAPTENDGGATSEEIGQVCAAAATVGQQSQSESDEVTEEKKTTESLKAASDRPAPPSPPRTIRLVFEMTPDQYALYEQAESRVRAQEGRRLPRAEVLKRMAESVLSQGTAKARARHQVLVHTVEGSDEAWYETERGVLPVASEVLEEALGGHEVLRIGVDGRVETPLGTPASEKSGALPIARSTNVAECELEPNSLTKGAQDDEQKEVSPGPVDGQRAASSRPSHGTGSVELTSDHTCDSARERNDCPPATHTSVYSPKRTAIPNATIRRVFARAGHRCECCGRKGGRLDVHHRDPVSEGGSSDPRCLELLCRACHTKNHEPDFESKAHWRAARERSLNGQFAIDATSVPWGRSRGDKRRTSVPRGTPGELNPLPLSASEIPSS